MSIDGNSVLISMSHTEIPRLPHDDDDPNEDEDMADPDERRSRKSAILVSRFSTETRRTQRKTATLKFNMTNRSPTLRMKVPAVDVIGRIGKRRSA